MSVDRHAPFIVCGVLVALATVTGCAELGLIDDHSSLSLGRSNGGALRRGARLPTMGDGWVVPPRWTARGAQYGTDELVDLIIGSARRVALREPGPALAIADLSPASGGATSWHRSHQSGRDADLLFFVTDVNGNPVDAVEMRRFGGDGATIDDIEDGQVRPPLRFDVARNWGLVRALLEGHEADIQFLFIYQPLAATLVSYARGLGEPPDLIARADAMLRQPGDSAPHDDHLHLRVWCSARDLVEGCIDRGERIAEPLEVVAVAELPGEAQVLLGAPMPAMAVLWGRLLW